MSEDKQEVIVKRNPIAKSFRAGINQPKVIPNKKRDRRVKHRKPFAIDQE